MNEIGRLEGSIVDCYVHNWHPFQKSIGQSVALVALNVDAGNLSVEQEGELLKIAKLLARQLVGNGTAKYISLQDIPTEVLQEERNLLLRIYQNQVSENTSLLRL